MDIYWRDAHVCPSEDEYKEMVIRSKYPDAALCVSKVTHTHTISMHISSSLVYILPVPKVS